MMKNCDLGHSFSPYGPPSRQITYMYSLLTDMGGHASWLTLGDPLFVVRTLNQTISRDFRFELLST